LGIIVFDASDVFLVTQLHAALRPMYDCGKCSRDFIDGAFVIFWGGDVSLSCREVVYNIGAFECYSYGGVFK
jgi:hypothetical protein